MKLPNIVSFCSRIRSDHTAVLRPGASKGCEIGFKLQRGGGYTMSPVAEEA